MIATELPTTRVDIRRYNAPQNKRDVTLLANAAAVTTGAAFNVGAGYSFTFFLRGVGLTGTNVVVIQAQAPDGSWYDWKTYSLDTGNPLKIVEALSAVRMIRAKVSVYTAGTITVSAIIVNHSALVEMQDPVSVDWSQITNVPPEVTGGAGVAELDVLVPMPLSGELAADALAGYFKARKACSIVGLAYTLGDAAVGSAVVLDVTLNGTAQGKNVNVAAGATAGQAIFGSPVAMALDDVMRVKVVSIGSTFAGAFLNASLIIAAAAPSDVEKFIYAPAIRGGDLAVDQTIGYFQPLKACEAIGIDIALGDAPVGADIQLDVTLNGVAQSKIVTVTAGQSLAQGIFSSPVTLAPGDILRVKVVQVGSTAPGSFLTANLIIAPTA